MKIRLVNRKAKVVGTEDAKSLDWVDEEPVEIDLVDAPSNLEPPRILNEVAEFNEKQIRISLSINPLGDCLVKQKLIVTE